MRLLSTFLALCLCGAASLSSSRIALHRIDNGFHARPRHIWRFSRGRKPMSFHIALNHPHRLWEPCDDGDHECIAADIFHTVYANNQTAAAEAQLEQYLEWGFDGAGYDAPAIHWAHMPFMAITGVLGDGHGGGPNCWQPNSKLVFPDPWNASIVARMAAAVQRKCDQVRDFRHNLLGYIWNDTPAFDIAKAQTVHGSDWVSTIRCLPHGSAGRTQYIAFLRARYGDDVRAVCRQYNVSAPNVDCTSYDTFDFCRLNNTSPGQGSESLLKDDYAFMPHIVEAYYSVANASIRACDPDAIVFGDTIRTPWTPDAILSTIAKYVDAISYQPDTAEYDAAEMERVHKIAGGKPMVIADIGFSFPHRPYTNMEWQSYPSQVAAAAAYRSFLLGAVHSGFIMALNKCGYIDRVLVQPDVVLKPGMLDFNGTLHQPFGALLSQANRDAKMLEWSFQSMQKVDKISSV